MWGSGQMSKELTVEEMNKQGFNDGGNQVGKHCAAADGNEMSTTLIMGEKQGGKHLPTMEKENRDSRMGEATESKWGA